MQSAPFELEFPSDRVLEGFAREVISHARADHYLSDRNRAFGELVNERLRIARELHDGLLQSLTGAALQLEAALRILPSEPDIARQRIREVQELIVERQRELRLFLERVRHSESGQSFPHVDLADVLQKLRDRVSRWGPRVELHAHGLTQIPGPLADHVYRLVEEGLSNVTRHARARVANVYVKTGGKVVRVVIADDGCGFPFRGRYDLAILDARGIGPASLKERVKSLAGNLVLTSTLSGSKIEIELPVSMPFPNPDIASQVQP